MPSANTKALIRLLECASWYKFLLFACITFKFSGDANELKIKLKILDSYYDVMTTFILEPSSVTDDCRSWIRGEQIISMKGCGHKKA